MLLCRQAQLQLCPGGAVSEVPTLGHDAPVPDVPAGGAFTPLLHVPYACFLQDVIEQVALTGVCKGALASSIPRFRFGHGVCRSHHHTPTALARIAVFGGSRKFPPPVGVITTHFVLQTRNVLRLSMADVVHDGHVLGRTTVWVCHNRLSEEKSYSCSKSQKRLDFV